MAKIGLSNYPDKIKEYFFENTHEFLVAIGGGHTGGTTFDKTLWTARVPILGYVDVNTGRKSGIRASLQFVMTEEEHTSNSYFKLFEQGKIYRIKGLLPKALGDKQADNEFRMSGLYVREIISNNERNDFLQGLFDEYNKPVTVTSEIFGLMTLDKEFDWYSGKAIWLGTEVDVSIDVPDENYDVSDILKIAEQFFKDQAEWDKKLREFAAEELTDLANDWANDAVEEGEGPEKITEGDFARRITIESIGFDDEGEFTVYFGDDDMFWGHSVTVYGSIEKGLTDAQIEG